MKIHYIVALAIISASLGGVAMETIRAQAKPPAYIIAEIAIKDHEGYRKAVPTRVKAIEAAGGKFIVRTDNVIGVEGEPPAKRIVVTRYDNLDQLQAWTKSQAFKDTGIDQFADVRAYAVEGVAP